MSREKHLQEKTPEGITQSQTLTSVTENSHTTRRVERVNSTGRRHRYLCMHAYATSKDATENDTPSAMRRVAVRALAGNYSQEATGEQQDELRLPPSGHNSQAFLGRLVSKRNQPPSPDPQAACVSPHTAQDLENEHERPACAESLRLLSLMRSAQPLECGNLARLLCQFRRAPTFNPLLPSATGPFGRGYA